MDRWPVRTWGGRHRDQGRQHYALQRSGLIRVIGKSEAAYFAMINEQGGIKGRKINFISRDDAYSPLKTVEQVRKMVEEDGVLLLFQPLGTPSHGLTLAVKDRQRSLNSSSPIR